MRLQNNICPRCRHPLDTPGNCQQCRAAPQAKTEFLSSLPSLFLFFLGAVLLGSSWSAWLSMLLGDDAEWLRLVAELLLAIGYYYACRYLFLLFQSARRSFKAWF